jgi:hypothetical protein
MSMAKPPAGIYVVAVAFFIAAMVCTVWVLSIVLGALGLDARLNVTTLKWMLPAYVLALCLVCYAVALLVRLHPVPQWVMVGMTVFLLVQAVTTPADSPFYSVPRIYLNRTMLLLPMIASCVYLVRLRGRATPRSSRVSSKKG